MAFCLKNSFCRTASLLSSRESTFVKSAKAFVTTLSTSSDEEVVRDITASEKKRYAFLLGYRGEKYYGACMNPGQEHILTVSKELVTALIKAGYVDDSYLKSAKSTSQASRTDTGVSALRQLITMDLKEGVDLEEVRPLLSEDLKLYGMVKTIRRFVPFRYCWARSYLYYIPSYVFAPLDMEMHLNYRLTSEAKEKIQRSLGKFLGNRNYHNFTRSMSFHDPRAMRQISKVELLEPVIKDGMELVCIRLQGESFILNQIRKIIGALVVVVRGYVPGEMIDIALSKQGIEVRRAPPDGLMLEQLDFDFYNKRFKNYGFPPIDFSAHETEVEALKDKILSRLVATEMKYEKTKLWVEMLQYTAFQAHSKEHRALESSLAYDDTLNLYRSENVTISGKNPAALFI